jgi:hypothetical protein
MRSKYHEVGAEQRARRLEQIRETEGFSLTLRPLVLPRIRAFKVFERSPDLH